jgi:hypothetical protein
MRNQYQKKQHFAAMLYQFVGEDEFYDEIDELNDQIEGLEGDLGDMQAQVESGGVSNGGNVGSGLKPPATILEGDEDKPSDRSESSDQAGASKSGQRV